MASDFKPATDRSLADLNRANRDAWDSGEFRHGDAEPTRQTLLTSAKKSGLTAHKYEGLGNTKCNKEGCGHTLGHPIHTGRAADVRHPKGGGQQVVGSSGEVVVHAHDEHQPHPGATSLVPSYGATVQAENERKLKTPEGNAERLRRNEERLKKHKLGDRAVHLPRTAKRTWKNGVWS